MDSKITKMLLSYYHHIDCTLKLSVDGKLLEIDLDNLKPVVALFAKHAVYERQDWEPMTGKNEIINFFYEKRSLDGKHYVNEDDVIEERGINPEIRDKFSKHFSHVDLNICKTIIVNGIFEGNYYLTENKNGLRNIKFSTPVKLSFKDYWVIDECDNVIYRYSHISPIAKTVAADASVNRLSKY